MFLVNTFISLLKTPLDFANIKISVVVFKTHLKLTALTFKWELKRIKKFLFRKSGIIKQV